MRTSDLKLPSIFKSTIIATALIFSASCKERNPLEVKTSEPTPSESAPAEPVSDTSTTSEGESGEAPTSETALTSNKVVPPGTVILDIGGGKNGSVDLFEDTLTADENPYIWILDYDPCLQPGVVCLEDKSVGHFELRAGYDTLKIVNGKKTTDTKAFALKNDTSRAVGIYFCKSSSDCSKSRFAKIKKGAVMNLVVNSGKTEFVINRYFSEKVKGKMKFVLKGTNVITKAGKDKSWGQKAISITKIGVKPK